MPFREVSAEIRAILHVELIRSVIGKLMAKVWTHQELVREGVAATLLVPLTIITSKPSLLALVLKLIMRFSFL